MANKTKLYILRWMNSGEGHEVTGRGSSILELYHILSDTITSEDVATIRLSIKNSGVIIGPARLMQEIGTNIVPERSSKIDGHGNVEFGYGDGTCALIRVAYIADGYARNSSGACAFCDGDPLGENSNESAPISIFYRKNPRAQTCPYCNGRPS